MRYLSVCSGIEAATCAWHPLGWTPVGFSEIEKFPAAVLAHHYPDVPNFGDMTKFEEWPDDIAPDVLVGGTPCQSFSVAGLRKGLADPRGNLMLTFGSIARRYRPQWLVWENVPGVLSSNGGRDFGTFLGMLAELGFGFAYRVLDAQYFGLAQQRKRVFVVGCLGDWRRAAAVLFERHSLSGHPAPRREAGQETAGTLASRTGAGGFPGTDEACSGYVQPVAVALRGRNGGATAELGDDVAFTLRASSGGGDKPYVTYGVADTLTSHWHRSNGAKAGNNSGMINPVYHDMRVRRLTPRECERLQGFPDDYTAIPWRGKAASECPDGPRYEALGNSMAVPVMRWIGGRIDMVSAISANQEAA